MIWQTLTKPQIPSQYEECLKPYNNDWYRITLGFYFNPEDSAVTTSVLYHIINNKTGVIEHQGAYLPSVLQMFKGLTEAMNKVLTAPVNFIEIVQ